MKLQYQHWQEMLFNQERKGKLHHKILIQHKDILLTAV